MKDLTLHIKNIHIEYLKEILRNAKEENIPITLKIEKLFLVNLNEVKEIENDQTIYFNS